MAWYKNFEKNWEKIQQPTPIAFSIECGSFIFSLARERSALGIYSCGKLYFQKPECMAVMTPLDEYEKKKQAIVEEFKRGLIGNDRTFSLEKKTSNLFRNRQPSPSKEA